MQDDENEQDLTKRSDFRTRWRTSKEAIFNDKDVDVGERLITGENRVLRGDGTEVKLGRNVVKKLLKD